MNVEWRNFLENTSDWSGNDTKYSHEWLKTQNMFSNDILGHVLLENQSDFWQISSDLVVQLVDIKPKALIPLEKTDDDVQYLRFTNTCAESNVLGYKRDKIARCLTLAIILIHSIS